MKFKESGKDLTADERAQMAVKDALVPYADGSPELRLYNKFVREFIHSSKLTRAQLTEASWVADKKLKHVWERYAHDAAYGQMSTAQKQGVMKFALSHAVAMHYTLDAIRLATEADYAARESELLRDILVEDRVVAVAEAIAKGLLSKLTLGASKVAELSVVFADARLRHAAAKECAEKYYRGGADADDAMTAFDLKGLDDEATLGCVAAFAAMKMDRLGTRAAAQLGAQVLATAGVAVASEIVGAVVQGDQAIRNVAKRLSENLGLAREAAAVALWGLGNRGHAPSIAFMKAFGILDRDGLLVVGGFFDRQNMRVASTYIAARLKSTAG